MKPDIQEIFDSVPADEPRSRLDPYRELIMRWRRQGKSHDRIRALLAEKCGVKVAFGPLYRYIKRRSKPRKLQPEPGSEQLNVSPVEPSLPVGTGKKLSAEERAAQLEFIRSLNKPELQDQPAKPRWNFDADKPRTLHKP